MIDAQAVVDATVRAAQVAALRRRAWLLSQAAGKLAGRTGRPLPMPALGSTSGLTTAVAVRAWLDVYA